MIDLRCPTASALSAFQPQALPKCTSHCMGRPNEPASLQLRNDFSSEVPQTFRQDRWHEQKAISRAGAEPVFKIIGNAFRCANYGAVTARAGNSLRKLPQREPLAAR